MTLKKTYFDGTTAIESSEGIYYGVNMNEYTVQYSKAIPLTKALVKTPWIIHEMKQNCRNPNNFSALARPGDYAYLC